MLPQFIISFREILEISILIGVATTYLARLQYGHVIRYIWLGAFLGVLASALLGLGLWWFYGGLPEQYEKLFEAIASILAAAVITSIVTFLARKGHQGLKDKLNQELSHDTLGRIILGLTFFGFIAVFREGVEIVLFLTPFVINTPLQTALSFSLGLVMAGGIGFALYWLGMKIPLRKLFYYSNILLVFIASGVLGYGIHELIEYWTLNDISIGWLGTYAFNLNIPSESIFSHKGLIGSVFAALFGYATKMEWARVLAQGLYLIIFLPWVLPAWRRAKLFNYLKKLVPFRAAS